MVMPSKTPLSDDIVSDDTALTLPPTRMVNQTGFTGEHKAWKVSHDQRKIREPFFDGSSGARSAFGA